MTGVGLKKHSQTQVDFAEVGFTGYGDRLLAYPACPNEGAAELVVNEVWESCFNDTRPFDK
jgi:activator of 2-hydroxyglutaryl-CoA dehydratase